MNYNEFLEMKSEFASYIYRYEYFLKCGTINDCYYTNFFSSMVNEIRRVDVENNVMISVIKMKNEGKSDEEIKEYLNKSKEAFKNEKDRMELKNKLAKEVVLNTDKLSNEDKKNFEEIFLDYVRKNHPVVKCLVSDEEEKLFHVLDKLYKENNYTGFKEILDMNKNLFKDAEYKEEDYNKISGYYYDMKKRINQDYMKKQQSYPYNKQETLKNDISVAREMGDLKARLNEFKAANKNIHKDYINIFENDFSID